MVSKVEWKKPPQVRSNPVWQVWNCFSYCCRYIKFFGVSSFDSDQNPNGKKGLSPSSSVIVYCSTNILIVRLSLQADCLWWGKQGEILAISAGGECCSNAKRKKQNNPIQSYWTRCRACASGQCSQNSVHRTQQAWRKSSSTGLHKATGSANPRVHLSDTWRRCGSAALVYKLWEYWMSAVGMSLCLCFFPIFLIDLITIHFTRKYRRHLLLHLLAIFILSLACWSELLNFCLFWKSYCRSCCSCRIEFERLLLQDLGLSFFIPALGMLARASTSTSRCVWSSLLTSSQVNVAFSTCKSRFQLPQLDISFESRMSEWCEESIKVFKR